MNMKHVAIILFHEISKNIHLISEDIPNLNKWIKHDIFETLLKIDLYYLTIELIIFKVRKQY